MNVVCEWRAPGQISYFDKINGVEVYSFLHAEKPLVVSTDSLGNAGSKEIEEIGMKAVMIFPILKQESGNMVLSLNHRTQGHVWSMAEIKFTADAVKILQSILTRRIQKNSLAGSYAALEEILDNVGCAIYVTDQTTGRMLFANQILKIPLPRNCWITILMLCYRAVSAKKNQVSQCSLPCGEGDLVRSAVQGDCLGGR